MTPAQAIKTCFLKTFTYSGRAKPSEYWWFYASMILALLVLFFARSLLWEYWPRDVPALSIAYLIVIDKVLDVVTWLITVFWLFARFSVASRRLHDVGRSGWWQLLEITGIGSILLFIWYVMPSQRTENRYGSPPASN
jgi:uncharacterized membrane protein YhaH (DUF805 family)